MLDLPYARFRQEVRLAAEAYEAEANDRLRAAFVTGWHSIAAMGGKKTPTLPAYLTSLGLIERQSRLRTGKMRVSPAERSKATENFEKVREAFREARRRPIE